jgi:Raf kinase inhibitor-like YbhB/YbcL family protein
MEITSSAFGSGEMIPAKYTCDGADFSPPLEWSGSPAGTKSFALVCDDPDAPMGTWVHWVIFDIPPSATMLGEGITREKDLPGGGTQGINDFRKIGYGGPCPPGGTHRYFFKLYAGPQAGDHEGPAPDSHAGAHPRRSANCGNVPPLKRQAKGQRQKANGIEDGFVLGPSP